MLNMESTEHRGSGISESGSEWSDGTVHFHRTGANVKTGLPGKVDRLFPDSYETVIVNLF